jgi:excisionase family DNA binding protein
MSRLISEPSAVVGGSAAFLLSRLLRAAPVIAYMCRAGWVGGDDFDATLAAIHAAGRGWESTIKLPQRENARGRELSRPGYATIEEAAETLHLSRRRTQELAQAGSITGRRVGRRWQLDQRSIMIYQQRK